MCREDEIELLDTVIQNLKSLQLSNPIKLTFGAVTRFQDGKGVLLTDATKNVEFDDLRRKILTGINQSPRQHSPHITLMHPRNSSCTDDIFNQLKQFEFPTALSFEKISLIEQYNSERWRVMQEFQISI